MTAPPAPFLPEDVHGKKIVVVSVCWAGPREEGEEVVRLLRALGTPLADLLGPVPYVALQQLIDPMYAAGAANYFTSAFLDELPGPALETLADAHQRSAGLPASCELHVHLVGGAMARTAPGATAFSQRQAPYLLNCITTGSSLANRSRVPAGSSAAPVQAALPRGRRLATSCWPDGAVHRGRDLAGTCAGLDRGAGPGSRERGHRAT
jgi:hypothetical protein